jgi:hypothetical protein
MGLNRLVRNPYLILASCLALSLAALLYLNPENGPQEESHAIVLFVAIVFLTFLIRPIYDFYLKSLSYLILGMAGYWFFGHGLVSCPFITTPEIPTIIALSSLGAIASLITYSDGRLSGHMFAAGSLMLLFSENGLKSATCPLLMFASAHTFVYFVSKITAPQDFNKNLTLGSFASAFFMVAATFAKILAGLYPGVYPQPSILHMLLGFGFVFIANILFTWLSLKAHDLTLSRINMKRFVEEERVFYGTLHEPTRAVPSHTKKKK